MNRNSWARKLSFCYYPLKKQFCHSLEALYGVLMATPLLPSRSSDHQKWFIIKGNMEGGGSREKLEDLKSLHTLMGEMNLSKISHWKLVLQRHRMSTIGSGESSINFLPHPTHHGWWRYEWTKPLYFCWRASENCFNTWEWRDKYSLLNSKAERISLVHHISLGSLRGLILDIHSLLLPSELLLPW